MSRIIRNNAQPSASLSVIGSVKVGEKSERGLPRSTDYFVFSSENAEYIKFVTEKYGDKPTTLPITFLSNDMASVCNHRYELRGKDGKRIAYGNGQEFQKAQKQGYTVVDVPVRPHAPEAWMKQEEEAAGAEWKEVLTLRFYIVGVPILGVWKFETKAKESTIPSIIQTVDTVMNVAGRISEIPFDLSVKKVTSDKAGAKNTYPVVSLTCNLSADAAQKVRDLPQNAYFGRLNEGMLLGTGAPVQNSNTTEAEAECLDYSEYEEVNPYTDLRTDEQFNTEAQNIKALPDKKRAAELAKMLSEAAAEWGLTFNKNTGKYEQ